MIIQKENTVGWVSTYQSNISVKIFFFKIIIGITRSFEL